MNALDAGASAEIPAAAPAGSAPSSPPAESRPARRRIGFSPWAWGSWLVAALVALPVLVVVSRVFVHTEGVWDHLAQTVLSEYLFNTAALVGMVGVGVLTIGVAAAWTVTMCRFPGSRTLEWALLLPLAVPAYVMAYAYTDLLQFVGPVQTALRTWFGWTRRDYWFPDIRSLGGAAAVLTLVLYPYVYLMSRAAFLEQSVCVLEVSRTLGRGPWAAFFRVALPLARPAVAGGVALALMEVLADFGTVQYFAINTFTTGIYRTWFAMGQPAAAAQLAAALLGFVAILVALEYWSRRQARFHHTSARYRRLPTYRLRGWRAAAALIGCSSLIVVGFIAPCAALISLSLDVGGDARFIAHFLDLALNSLTLATAAAVMAVTLAVMLAYGKRLHASPALEAAVRTASLGYAIPGSVVAVGVLIPFAWFDNAVDAWMREHFNLSTGLMLSGTVAAVLFAYLVRFLAVAFNAVDSSFGKIRINMDHASRVLGCTPGQTLRRVHAPLMWGSLLTAGLMVFVDVMKELPATMIVRPFNFDTLAIRVYQMASDERLGEAAPAALAIVAVGVIPVIVLSRAIAASRPGGKD